MALPSNPQTLATYDITKSDQAKIFVKKVSDLFQALSTAIGLSGILNGGGSLFNTSLFYQSVSLGTVTTNQTVDCVNAAGVSIYCAVSTAFSPLITLAHLALAVPVTIWFQNNSGSTITLTIAATQPGGTAYTGVRWKTSTSIINMATGASLTTGVQMIASGAAVPLTNWYLTMVAN